MYCPNCGNKLNDAEVFCPSCGTKLQEQILNIPNNNTTIDQISKNSTEFIKPRMEKAQNFIARHKKSLGITTCVILLVILGIFGFNSFGGLETLSWNKNYSDWNLKYVTQSKVKLGVNFSDKDKVDKIKYTATCGNVVSDGLEVSWNLTDAIGECKITATYKAKKINKEYTVVPFDLADEELAMDYDIDLDSEEDLDFDNLTNKQEKEYHTNPVLSDSDMDGLDDDYEIITSKTDPNKIDTDGDGLSDYDEMKLGLSPLKIDSKGDGKKDGTRKLNYNYTESGLSLVITGQGNIASTIAEVNTNTKISGKKGLIDKLYTFYTEGTIDKAEVTIPYTEEDLTTYNLNADNLTIYYYNEENSEYEKIPTTINKDNHTLTATLSHFSNYVVGDNSFIEDKIKTEILFVLDNSWSMYNNEQYKKFTGKDYAVLYPQTPTLEASDVNGERFILTSDLVSRLALKNYQMGLAEFRRDYALSKAIGTNHTDIEEALINMNGKFITKTEGTNIGNALLNSIKEFSKDSDNKFVVLLTDGVDASLKGNARNVINQATSNNVKICSIGFGVGANNNDLANISNSTGCQFFSSSNANGLAELFDIIGAELNDNLVDIDGDGITDGILIADSGFVVNRDGFSFKNYTTNLATKGHCYGMATFAELYYKKVLPLNVGSKTVKNKTSYAYNLNSDYFKNYRSLYDYQFKTNALKHFFGFDVLGEETPADYRDLKDNTLIYTDAYKKEIENSQIFDIEVDRTVLSKDEQLKKYGVNYTLSENLIFNEDKMQKSLVINYDDKQLFNAIYASFIKQYNTNFYSSATNFALWFRNTFKLEHVSTPSESKFITILKDRLNNRDPLVLSSDYGEGYHAVNAINLIQDIKNPNYYYIAVYDNSYPGEKRYVDLECKNDKCLTKANSYYSKSNQPIRISVSLEEDLEYFK